MKVFVINNNGAGFADTVEVPDGTTIKALFEQTSATAIPEESPRNCSVRPLRLINDLTPERP